MASARNPLAELNHNGLTLTPELMLQLDAPGKKGGKPKPVASTTATTTNSKKRKATAAPEPVEEIDEDDPRLEEYRWSCNQVRAKIRKLIENKEMKVSEFQDAINVSSKAYYSFMKQSQKMSGEFSSVYPSAHRFFAKRELQGVKRKKKAATAAKKLDLSQYDVSEVHLPGEEEVDVAVFDHCDEIRKKVNAFLRQTGMTRTAFCREISKTFPDGRSLQGHTLTRFLGKSGPREGSTCAIFYAAYVFFEKLRIRDGKPKTQLREEMENVWGLDGFDRKTSPSTVYICHASSYMYVDQYGRVRSARR